MSDTVGSTRAAKQKRGEEEKREQIIHPIKRPSFAIYQKTGAPSDRTKESGETEKKISSLPMVYEGCANRRRLKKAYERLFFFILQVAKYQRFHCQQSLAMIFTTIISVIVFCSADIIFCYDALCTAYTVRAFAN